MLKNLEGCISAIHQLILMKFGTQTKLDMLSPKNSTMTLRRHLPRWPPPPCRKTRDGCLSAIIDAILMKFGTQAKIDMLSRKISTMLVRRHFSRWLPPFSWDKMFAFN
jgi:hypothetical protein